MPFSETFDSAKPLVSWLGSVYSGTNHEELLSSLLSISCQDINIPQEIVLVLDGPVSALILSTLQRFERESDLLFSIHKLDRNVGLANALNFGLSFCSGVYIARFDTDDVNLPNRLRVQFEFLENNPSVSLVGSSCYEFTTSCSHETVNALFRSTCLSADISKLLNIVNPIYHPTVMVRLKDLQSLGGYPDIKYFEDYSLWLCMKAASLSLANLSTPLVAMRTDCIISRRVSESYAKHELNFIRWAFFANNLIPFIFLPFFVFRIVSRLITLNVFQKLLRPGRALIRIQNPDLVRDC